MTDLVVISLEAWDGVWRRNQHLVSGLLRADPGLRVLFVEPAADPLYAVSSGSWPHRGRGTRPARLDETEDEGRLWLYQPTKLLPRRVNRRVDARWAHGIRRASQRLGFRGPLLWVNDPEGATLLAQTGWSALYDITDDWLEAERTPAEHDRLIRNEAILLDQCAEVVVCSPALVATKGTTRSVSLVPNAVDIDAYRAPAPRPADLPDGPVAIYLGTIHTDRIDLHLCEATAHALRGHGHLVMVGPAPLSGTDRDRLLESGVVLLGPKDRTAVPGYLQHADVLVVPHVLTSFTDSLDPIKRYEYRAVGRPVVSTPVPGFRESTDPQITIAQGVDFVDAVLCALPASTRFPEGWQGDRVPTWAERVKEMAKVIERLRAAAPAERRRTPDPAGGTGDTGDTGDTSLTMGSVAIAHDYLTQRGGAERVVLAMLRAFPGATLYTTLYDPDGTYPEFRDAHIVTSPLNHFGLIRRHHRLALPLLPFAARSLKVAEDVVVMSSSGWAHGFDARGKRLVYCHAPARWLYQTETYLGQQPRKSFQGNVLLVLRPWLLRWDRRAAASGDRYLANSRVVRDRIHDAYGIEATVLPAPHSIDVAAQQAPVDRIADWAQHPAGHSSESAGFYLVVSRLLTYKNVDKAVEAFRGLEERLVVVGVGPERRSLERALPSNVRLVSGLTDAQMRWAYSNSRAVIAPSFEDFGLTPLEGAAFGKPCLALRAGGYLDTVLAGTSGMFFDAPTAKAIRAAVLANRTTTWSPSAIIQHAQKFAEPQFNERLREAVRQLHV